MVREWWLTVFAIVLTWCVLTFCRAYVEAAGETCEDGGSVACEPAVVSSSAWEVIDDRRERRWVVPERVVVEDAAEEYDDGYDREYVLCVLTAEAGCDGELCMAVAQSLWNACARYGWEYNPAEVMVLYRYTGPLGWWSDEAEDAYRLIFESGYVYEPVGDATLFYAPRYCESAWHESHEFIAEISGIRFFREDMRQ